VFSEEEAERLPSERVENIGIKLKKGSPEELDCSIYSLTAKETDVLRQTLKEDKAKGYIVHKTSSYVSPIFFIPKKDGKELHMVVDY
jgi:hypothetical protein